MIEQSMEQVIRNIDGRVTRIEQFLPSLATREELQEIEVSSRLYFEDGAHFMTVTLLTQIDQPRPLTSHITFVLLEFLSPRAEAVPTVRSAA